MDRFFLVVCSPNAAVSGGTEAAIECVSPAIRSAVPLPDVFILRSGFSFVFKISGWGGGQAFFKPKYARSSAGSIGLGVPHFTTFAGGGPGLGLLGVWMLKIFTVVTWLHRSTPQYCDVGWILNVCSFLFFFSHNRSVCCLPFLINEPPSPLQ